MLPNFFFARYALEIICRRQRNNDTSYRIVTHCYAMSRDVTYTRTDLNIINIHSVRSDCSNFFSLAPLANCCTTVVQCSLMLCNLMKCCAQNVTQHRSMLRNIPMFAILCSATPTWSGVARYRPWSAKPFSLACAGHCFAMSHNITKTWADAALNLINIHYHEMMSKISFRSLRSRYTVCISCSLR